MSCYVEKVIEVARKEVGYSEKASNSKLDSKTANAGYKNYTKYARDLDKVSGFYNGKKNGFAWCDVFVDWCFYKAYGTANAKRLLYQPSKSLGAGCEYSMQYYKKNGRFKTSPKIGDQIFFKNSKGEICHTGLVYKVDKTYVYTVEGNTSSASGVVSDGGGVREKKYKRTSSSIAGYGRPAYTTTSYQCIHKVVKDDTLWDLAVKYLGKGTRYKEIMTMNSKKTSDLKIGEKLKIPKK